MGDSRLANYRINEQQVEDPTRNDKVLESTNSGNITLDDTEYELEKDDQIKIEVEDDGELDNGDLGRRG